MDQDPDDGAGVLVHGGLGRGLGISAVGTCTGDVGRMPSTRALPIGVYGECLSETTTACLEL